MIASSSHPDLLGGWDTWAETAMPGPASMPAPEGMTTGPTVSWTLKMVTVAMESPHASFEKRMKQGLLAFKSAQHVVTTEFSVICSMGTQTLGNCFILC